MMYYAQIQNGVVIGVSQVAEPITSTDLIEITELDASLIGCSHANGEFIAPPTAIARTFKSWPAFDFYRRLTSAERIAIRERAKTDPIAEDIYATLNAAIASGANVRDDDPDTLAGLAYLESTGDLAPGRTLAILT
jgi:hypothetical protein